MAEKTIPISFRLLSDSIEKSFDFGFRTDAQKAAAFVLLGTHSRWAFARARDANRIVHYSQGKVDQLIDQLQVHYPEVRKLVASWIPYEAEDYTLPAGDAARAEIEITRIAPDGNLITEERHDPVHKFVEVYVDEVCFRQRAADPRDKSPVVPTKGKYVRISVPGNVPGAVVLPVDPISHRVLLVTQYRHPQRRFLTEAPRGFGILGLDKTTLDTALREMDEETGAVPLEVDGASAIYFLKDLFTDTGKLVEAPAFFLAYVDADLQTEKLNRLEPTMEDPVWVSLTKFYEAVYSTEPLLLDDSDYESALSEEWRERLNADHPMRHGLLAITDGFTFAVAMLALPRLEKDLGLGISRKLFP